MWLWWRGDKEMVAVGSHGRMMRDLFPHCVLRLPNVDGLSEQVSVVVGQQHQTWQRESLLAQAKEDIYSVWAQPLQDDIVGRGDHCLAWRHLIWLQRGTVDHQNAASHQWWGSQCPQTPFSVIGLDWEESEPQEQTEPMQRLKRLKRGSEAALPESLLDPRTVVSGWLMAWC